MEYEDNSFKSKGVESEDKEPEKKKLERVVSGTVKAKKKGAIGKFKDNFTEKDFSEVTASLLKDVFIPKVKETISGLITNGIDMLLYGESSPKSSDRRDRVSYQSYYKRPSERYIESRSRDVYSYEDYIIPTRGEAENVLRMMREQLDQYGVVSVSDLYELIGVVGTFVDCKYGWTDLRNSYVERVRDGYIVKLPKALPLD